MPAATGTHNGNWISIFYSVETGMNRLGPHQNDENMQKNNVLARILALLMGATRPPTSRNGRAADAIVPNMACMQDTRTEDPSEYFHGKRT
ncbi:MAG: hypothetical protein CVV32_03975 [Methanomicrobiales archaeon HGW-Methanomicrobiales-3]|jgi:hypothetical protein|nr:MAG: hypothetical protein CVV32_03975 [Methanomicrobiales archaeon HGW-Methanomicrobiales-3]